MTAPLPPANIAIPWQPVEVPSLPPPLLELGSSQQSSTAPPLPLIHVILRYLSSTRNSPSPPLIYRIPGMPVINHDNPTPSLHLCYILATRVNLSPSPYFSLITNISEATTCNTIYCPYTIHTHADKTLQDTAAGTGAAERTQYRILINRIKTNRLPTCYGLHGPLLILLRPLRHLEYMHAP